MVDNVPVALTNLVDYEFDEVGFNQRLRLILVETDHPGKLPSWFDACPVLAIHKLAKQYDARVGKAIGPSRYLALMVQSQPVPQEMTDVHPKIVTLQQAIQQKITPDTIVMLMLKAVKQCQFDEQLVLRNQRATDRLLLVHRQTEKTLVAVEVDLKDHILQLRTRTFKPVVAPQKMGFLASDGCLRWAGTAPGKLWDQHHVHGRKNTIDFFTLRALADFTQTKVGLQNALLKDLKQAYGDCFRQLPHFHASEVMAYSPKTKVPAIKQVMTLLQNQSLHLIGDASEPHIHALLVHLADRVRTSPQLVRAGVTVSVGEQAVAGLNLQVVMDEQDPRYQVGRNDQVIQHLTFEKFGNFDAVKQQYQWQGDQQADLMANKQFLMTVVQLLVKRDISTGELRLPTAVKADTAGHFKYLFFDRLSKRAEPLNLVVTRLAITPDQRVIFEETHIQGEINDSTATELQRTVKRILAVTGENPYLLQGAIQSQSGLFAIYGTNLITVPDADKITAQLRSGSEENLVSRQDLLTIAQGLVIDQEHVLQQQQLIAELTQLTKTELTIRELRMTLKLSWRTNAMKAFNAAFHQAQGQWLKLPIRQKVYEAYWTGTCGMGLLELSGSTYYFIGRSSALETQQKRAIPLKKIVAIGSLQPKADVYKIFHELESLMQVGFVRLNQYTVIPFPFKYLREYTDLRRHQTNQMKGATAANTD
ncbi:hypothetical protein [Levilactobacillus wangkuiensis]|uniref:hypothetical protein n=1 Tax=Levilactobacillus wangkuiensis TaxID=2799566 RepID=UPI001941760E|nr:hypothetical protein [Levilactobacillus wangkuiensis]